MKIGDHVGTIDSGSGQFFYKGRIISLDELTVCVSWDEPAEFGDAWLSRIEWIDLADVVLAPPEPDEPAKPAGGRQVPKPPVTPRGRPLGSPPVEWIDLGGGRRGPMRRM